MRRLYRSSCVSFCAPCPRVRVSFCGASPARSTLTTSLASVVHTTQGADHACGCRCRVPSRPSCARCSILSRQLSIDVPAELRTGPRRRRRRLAGVALVDRSCSFFPCLFVPLVDPPSPVLSSLHDTPPFSLLLRLSSSSVAPSQHFPILGLPQVLRTL